MGGCLGCRTEPPLVTSVDALSKGLKIKGKRVKKRMITEELWSTSSGDMDNHNRAFPSRRSISSVSTSNQTLDSSSSSAGGTSNHNEYVNHGLLLWNQTRQQWVGNKRSQKSVKAQEPKLSRNTTYEGLLDTNKPLSQPIPLWVSNSKSIGASLSVGSLLDSKGSMDRKWWTFLWMSGNRRGFMTD